MFMWWQLLYINKKLSKIVENLKFFKKNFKNKFFFWIFFSKSWNGGEFTKLRPKTELRNRGNHKLWNHEMRGSPVMRKTSNLCKIMGSVAFFVKYYIQYFGWNVSNHGFKEWISMKIMLMWLWKVIMSHFNHLKW